MDGYLFRSFNGARRLTCRMPAEQGTAATLQARPNAPGAPARISAIGCNADATTGPTPTQRCPSCSGSPRRPPRRPPEASVGQSFVPRVIPRCANDLSVAVTYPTRPEYAAPRADHRRRHRRSPSCRRAPTWAPGPPSSSEPEALQVRHPQLCHRGMLRRAGSSRYSGCRGSTLSLPRRLVALHPSTGLRGSRRRGERLQQAHVGVDADGTGEIAAVQRTTGLRR